MEWTNENRIVENETDHYHRAVVALLLVTSGALAQGPGSLGKPNIVLVFMDNKLSTGTLRRGAALTTGPSRTHNFN